MSCNTEMRPVFLLRDLAKNIRDCTCAMSGKSARLIVTLLMVQLSGCAEISRCMNADIHVGMSTDQAMPILQSCGRLSSEDISGASIWYFDDKLVTIGPIGFDRVGRPMQFGVVQITHLY
jgi:hypothetical protein